MKTKVKRKKGKGGSEQDWRDSEDWWKAPVLQGPENDYGEYDYLMERLPENSIEWAHGYQCKCDDCDKWSRHSKVYTQYFRTMDGWDSLDYKVCWKCVLKEKLYQTRLGKLVRKLRHARQVRANVRQAKETIKASSGKEVRI